MKSISNDDSSNSSVQSAFRWDANRTRGFAPSESCLFATSASSTEFEKDWNDSRIRRLLANKKSYVYHFLESCDSDWEHDPSAEEQHESREIEDIVILETDSENSTSNDTQMTLAQKIAEAAIFVVPDNDFIISEESVDDMKRFLGKIQAADSLCSLELECLPRVCQNQSISNLQNQPETQYPLSLSDCRDEKVEDIKSAYEELPNQSIQNLQNLLSTSGAIPDLQSNFEAQYHPRLSDCHNSEAVESIETSCKELPNRSVLDLQNQMSTSGAIPYLPNQPEAQYPPRLLDCHDGEVVESIETSCKEPPNQSVLRLQNQINTTGGMCDPSDMDRSDDTLVPHDNVFSAIKLQGGPTDDESVTSLFSDPLENEHLTYNDSSTPDTVPTPTTPGTVVPRESIKMQSIPLQPFNLQPISKDMRYCRTSTPAQNTRSKSKKVRFFSTTPKDKRSGERSKIPIPCYQTKWSTKKKSSAADPYDASYIDDEVTVENVFTEEPCTSPRNVNRQVNKTDEICLDETLCQNVANDSQSILIDTILEAIQKDFEDTVTEKPKKHRKKRSQRSVLTADSAVQTEPNVVDACVNTPKKWPAQKRNVNKNPEVSGAGVEQKSVSTVSKQKRSISKNSRRRPNAIHEDRYEPVVSLERNVKPTTRQTPKPPSRIHQILQETMNEPRMTDVGLRQTTLSPFFNGGKRAKGRKTEQSTESLQPSQSVQPRITNNVAYRSHISLLSSSSDARAASPTSFTIRHGSLITFNVSPQEDIYFQIDRLQLPELDNENYDQEEDKSSNNGGSRRCSFLCHITPSNRFETVSIVHLDEPADPLEHILHTVERNLTLHFQNNNLPTVESLYGDPTEICMDDIVNILLDDDLCCESGSDKDSDMDDTIRPAIYNIEKHRCSTINGSQEPVGFSQEFSPIRL